MRRMFIVAGRVVRQLLRNPRFLVLSVAAPLIIVYFLKIFFDTLPPTFDVASWSTSSPSCSAPSRSCRNARQARWRGCS
jgi:hypothetical protein